MLSGKPSTAAAKKETRKANGLTGPEKTVAKRAGAFDQFVSSFGLQ